MESMQLCKVIDEGSSGGFAKWFGEYVGLWENLGGLLFSCIITFLLTAYPPDHHPSPFSASKRKIDKANISVKVLYDPK